MGDTGTSSAVVGVLCSTLKSGMLSVRGVSMKPETLRGESGLLGLLGGSKCSEGGLHGAFDPCLGLIFHAKETL